MKRTLSFLVLVFFLVGCASPMQKRAKNLAQTIETEQSCTVEKTKVPSQCRSETIFSPVVEIVSLPLVLAVKGIGDLSNRIGALVVQLPKVVLLIPVEIAKDLYTVLQEIGSLFTPQKK